MGMRCHPSIQFLIQYRCNFIPLNFVLDLNLIDGLKRGEMSNEQDNTATVAIVIAVIAFFVTTAQLLQALFGTAEGFRRCQPFVIGGWSAEARRKWRWSEFRFETTFKTPHIKLSPVEDVTMPEHPSSVSGVLVTGDPISRKHTYSQYGLEDPTQDLLYAHKRFSPKEAGEGSNELASWLALLDQLHDHINLYWSPEVNGADLKRSQNLAVHLPLHRRKCPPSPWEIAYTCAMTLPAIIFRTRSWDFMPPDIVRPVASSTVGDIVALIHRLGMSFKELAPGQGTMRAEGNGQSIVSTSVRGFGILLQYTHDQAITQRSTEAWRGLTIPSAEADKFGFRIIPGYERFEIPEYCFGDSSELDSIKSAMDQLGLGKAQNSTYSDFFKRSNRFFGFSDLIAIAAPFMPLRHSTVIRILRPHRDAHDIPLTWYEGFVVFRMRLSELKRDKPEEVSERMKQVLEKVEHLTHQYSSNNNPPCWEEESWNVRVANGRSIAFLNEMRDVWVETDNYYSHLEKKYNLPNLDQGIFRYRDLMAAHISQALYYPDLSAKNIKEGDKKFAKDPHFHRRYDLGPGRSTRMAEAMHLYIDRIPEVEEFMHESGFSEKQIVRDAWWTLMLRAMCWHRNVSFSKDIPTTLIPSSLYGSKIPVYIA